MEVPQTEKDLKIPKIEIDEPNIQESHLNLSVVDQEIQEVLIEPNSVASQENNSTLNTDKSFNCEQCDLQFSNEIHLNRHKNTGCLYKEGIKYFPVIDDEILEVPLEMDSCDVKLEEVMEGDHPVVPEKKKRGYIINKRQTRIDSTHFYYEGRLWVPPKMKRKQGRPKKDGSLFILDRCEGKLEKKGRRGRPLKRVQGCQTKDEYEHAKKCWIEFLKSKDKEKAILERSEKRQKRMNERVCLNKEAVQNLPPIDDGIEEVYDGIGPKMETDEDLFQLKSCDRNLQAVIEDDNSTFKQEIIQIHGQENELELPKIEIDDLNIAEAVRRSGLLAFDEEIQRCATKCSKCGEVYSDTRVLSKHLLVCIPNRRKEAVEQLSKKQSIREPAIKEGHIDNGDKL